MKQLIAGRAKIDQSQLPGKYKVWSYQFTLYRRVMWPLKMSQIPSSTASKMDGKANSFIRKWLGLPRCFSETGLFGRNTLQLLLQSISLGYKQEKTRLILELRESTDQTVRNAKPKVLTGRRWNAQTEVGGPSRNYFSFISWAFLKFGFFSLRTPLHLKPSRHKDI